MKDFIFFPLALLVAGGIIASAALPGKDRLGCSSVSGAETGLKHIEVAGNDLCRMEAGGQADIRRITDTQGDITSIIIQAASGVLGDRTERNPHFRLAPDIEHAFAKNRVRISIEARPAAQLGASSFEAQYDSGQEGGSGWQVFRLKPGYQTYSFVWDVPERIVQESAVDYLAIRPIVPEKERAVEIRSVTFDKIGLTKAILRRQANAAKAEVTDQNSNDTIPSGE